nr:MAG TPA: distal tail protein [Bacteriophage sp.]
MSYPDLPNNRLIVNGVDLSIRFQMVLLDGYTLEPPEPKTYTVDIPGGNGVIDLTEALTGDVAYKNRKQEFTFAVIDVKNFEKVKTEVSNFLHGRAFDYTMTMDPGYTYHGRFSVDSYSHEAYANGLLGQFKIKVDADPYKLKEHCAYRLNATGGKLYHFESGRRPVHPTVECTQPTWFTWNGKEQLVPAGTYRLNDVVFTDGINELYVNSYKLLFVRWADLKNKQLTWNDLLDKRWDDIQRMGGDVEDAPQSWSELFDKTWDSLSEKSWDQLNFGRKQLPESIVYLTYDWEDL